jgi:hypothetical protein
VSCTTTLGGVLPTQLFHLVLGANDVPHIRSTHITLEAAVVEYLTTHPVVSCLVDNRFFPHAVARTNQSWPAVTYYRSSTDHAHGISGGGGFATATIALDIWSPNYGDVVEAAEAIREAMDTFRGWMGGIAIHAAWLESEDDSVEKPADGGGTYWYSRSIDFSIRFVESVPNF